MDRPNSAAAAVAVAPSADRLSVNSHLWLGGFGLWLSANALFWLLGFGVNYVNPDPAGPIPGWAAYLVLPAGGLCIAIVISVMGIVSGLRTLPRLDDSNPTHCLKLYGRYLVGTGLALLLGAMLLASMLVGLFASGGMAAEASKAKNSPVEVAVLIVLGALCSLVGALFFVANTLRQKRSARDLSEIGADTMSAGGANPPPTVEAFSREVFWGGLWYRLGEAVIFAIVASLIVHMMTAGGIAASSTPAEPTPGSPYIPKITYLWLPTISLLMGMFVKSGEALVFGVAQGLFRAAAAFFAAEPAAAKPAAAPKPVGEAEPKPAPGAPTRRAVVAEVVGTGEPARKVS